MLNRLFYCQFLFFSNKISCLSVCGETTTYSTAMCDISKEREFNYLLYGISQDVCVTLPPNFRQVWGNPSIRGQNIKFIPIFSLLTSESMF